MCGRFVSSRKRLELLEEFAVERDRVGDGRDPDYSDYNVAPTKQIYTVLDRKKDGGPEDGPARSGDQRQRELRLIRWGLVPSWAKDASGGARMINARAETVAVKPAFRSAFARRRCIIPADGYYEWMAPSSGGAAPPEEVTPRATPGLPGENPGPGRQGSSKVSKVKQPFYIYRTDGGILAFAGIYELWRDRSLPEDHERAWLWTASIITTDATDDIGRIHDRTPMVVPPEAWADWLDPANNDKDLLLAVMQPATSSGAGGLTSHPVSTAVNSVRNNGPDLIEALPPRAGADGGPSARGSGSGEAPRPSLF